MNSSSPLVSIIMNCHNGEEFLREAIDSVYAQSYTFWEIIFWDNASNDHSAEIATGYDDKLRYFYSEKKTKLGDARISATNEARGELFAFLDTDDYWMPDKLERQVNEYLNDPDVGVLYTRSLVKRNNRFILLYDQQILPSGNVFSQFMQRNFITFSSVMIPARVYHEFGGFPTGYMNSPDHNLYLRITEKYRVVGVESISCVYRLHEHNLSRQQSAVAVQESVQSILSFSESRESIVGLKNQYCDYALSLLRARQLKEFIKVVIQHGLYIYIIKFVSFFIYKKYKAITLTESQIDRTKKNKVRVAFVTPSTHGGGVESVFNTITSSMPQDRFNASYHSLFATDDGSSFGMSSTSAMSFRNIYGLFKLVNYVNKEKVDVLVTAVYYADIVGIFVSLFSRLKVHVVSIHNGIKYKDLKLRQKIAVKFLAFMSRVMKHSIVACSQAARDEHIRIGYRKEDFRTIINGVDTSLFLDRVPSKDFSRSKFNISNTSIVIGYFARYDKNKFHCDLLEIFSVINNAEKDLFLVLGGREIDESNREIVDAIDRLGIAESVTLIGNIEPSDMCDALNLLDIYASTSHAEALPVTILEAMACKLPCFSYDVGDTRKIVDDSSLIVDSFDKGQYADKLLRFIEKGQEEIGRTGTELRNRVVSHYSLDNMLNNYNYYLMDKVGYSNMLIENK